MTSLDTLRPGGPSHQFVVADRTLELRRDEQGMVCASHAGAPAIVCESGPMVLIWLGRGEPSFEVEGFCCADWTPMRWFHVDIAARPETVMRDLADVQHFEAVHGYTEVVVERALRYDGRAFTTTIRFGWDTGVARAHLPSRIHARVDGIGVQRTQVESLGGRFQSRHLILPTPRLGGITRVHAGYSVKPFTRGPLGQVEAQASLEYLGRVFRRDLARDAELWTGRSPHRGTNVEQLRRFDSWCAAFEDQP